MDSQSLFVLVGLDTYIERDPSLRFLDRQDANVLHVDRPGPCSYCERGGRVGVVKGEAQVHGDFLSAA